MKPLFLFPLLMLPALCDYRWEQAFAYISRDPTKCIYKGVVYSQYTTNLGAICSTIRRNLDFDYVQHCVQNQLLVYPIQLKAKAEDYNINPAEGTNLHLRGLTNGSGGDSVFYDKYAKVYCKDCIKEKPKKEGVFALPNDCDPSSPIVIDLNNDGFAFGGDENPVTFWIWPQFPFKQVLNWVIPYNDDAFLALDLNRNGAIDDGGELFGDGTVVWEENSYATNGLIALAQYDSLALGGNNDGILSPADYIWQDLLLWVDQDADGVSQADELIPLAQTDIIRWNLVADETDDRDLNGNWLRFKGTAESSNQTYHWVDVYFERYAELESPIKRGDLVTE